MFASNILLSRGLRSGIGIADSSSMSWCAALLWDAGQTLAGMRDMTMWRRHVYLTAFGVLRDRDAECCTIEDAQAGKRRRGARPRHAAVSSCDRR